jgi:hypothetical protein
MPQLAPKKHAASATPRPLILLELIGLSTRAAAASAQKMSK